MLDDTHHVESADLYVDVLRSKHADMYSLTANLAKSGIFNNVYTLEDLPLSHPRLETFYRRIEWFFPKYSFQKSLKSTVNLKEKHYDIIGMTGPFTINRQLLAFFPNAKIIFLEDGSGSYYGRIGVNLLSRKGSIIQKILKKGPAYIFPVNSFLYCPALYEGEYSSIIKKLNFPYDQLDLLKKLYNVKPYSPYKSKKAVFLDQPSFKWEKSSCTDELVIKAAASIYGEKMIVRPHPQSERIDFQGLEVDHELDMWELICAESIRDDTVLIGKYSTAQITPKVIFNREPYLIFTYNLYGEPDQRIVKGVEKIQRLYSNKAKIISVKSIEELTEILKIYSAN